MNLQEFQQLSKRTMPFGGEPKTNGAFENVLGNYAMGLVGEYFELVNAINKGDIDETRKEGGDVFHYSVGLLTILGEEFDESKVRKVVESDDEWMNEAFADVLEIPKKHIYHCHELDKEKLVQSVYQVITLLVYIFEIDLLEVLQMNIDKLKKRYPEKFNTADSIARIDVEGE